MAIILGYWQELGWQGGLARPASCNSLGAVQQSGAVLTTHLLVDETIREPHKVHDTRIGTPNTGHYVIQPAEQHTRTFCVAAGKEVSRERKLAAILQPKRALLDTKDIAPAPHATQPFLAWISCQVVLPHLNLSVPPTVQQTPAYSTSHATTLLLPLTAAS